MAPTELFDRRRQRSVPLLLIAMALAFVAARIVVKQWEARRSGEGDLVRWVPLEQSEALAKAQQKPILYDFTAEWCAPCHQLDDAVFRNERLAALINERFIAVRVVDRQQEEGMNDPLVTSIQQRYSVRAFPTVVIAVAGGDALQRMEGFGGAERFEQMMERAR